MSMEGSTSEPPGECVAFLDSRVSIPAEVASGWFGHAFVNTSDTVRKDGT